MTKSNSVSIDIHVKCKHCGDPCDDQVVEHDGNRFCCVGCSAVFSLLRDNNLTSYYKISGETKVGIRPESNKDYAFLDDLSIVSNLLNFESEERNKIIIELPTIHCSACIWLLENMSKLLEGIQSVRVEYLKKSCSILYDPRVVTLRQIIELLDRIGYPPRLQLELMDQKQVGNIDKSIYYKLGVGGFAFGNIMLLSFPEYLGLQSDVSYSFLAYLSIALAIPVLLYAGIEYLKSAWYSLRMRELGIELPIAIGMLVLFFRSVFEIITGTGEGYLDSFSGFVFFLLIGKWFQRYTLDSISFDRDYRSFLPIAVLRKQFDQWQHANINHLEIGDVIRIRNAEVIPCDGILVLGKASLDYSFVTGEERPQKVQVGEKIFAGGKQLLGAIDIKVIKPVSQSYLTQLWREEIFSQKKDGLESKLVGAVGKYFVLSILFIALGTFVYWYAIDMSIAMQATTAVLIIACPCVLALSIPFLYGNVMRILARHSIYVRNTATLETLANIDQIVFDKTGTLTDPQHLDILYRGVELSENDKVLIKTLAAQSSHPLSKSIYELLKTKSAEDIRDFQEVVGQGIQCNIAGQWIRMGSARFILDAVDSTETTVLIEIDGRYRGAYVFNQALREGIEPMLATLSEKYKLSLLTGDNRHDLNRMKSLFGSEECLHFEQKPIDKLNYIKGIQERGSSQVMMIGDGLNDAGALRQSNVGMVISQSQNNFTPASDMIISNSSFAELGKYLSFIKNTRVLLYGAFVFALIYNVIGLYFAVNGLLSPVVAAILMPASSLSVMVYGIVSSELSAIYILAKR